MSGVATQTSKSEPAALNLGDHVLSAHEVSAGGQRFVGLVALGEHQHGDLFAGAMGQNHGAANLLVRMAGVNAQTHGYFNCLVKLGLRGLLDQGDGLIGIVQLGAVDELQAAGIILTLLHFKSSLWSNGSNDPPTY